MTFRSGINGFGRIGRGFLRVALDRGLDVVAINDVVDTTTFAHLLRFDSTYGLAAAEVSADPGSLVINGRTIAVTAHREPFDIPWADFGVGVVVESTGRFRDRDAASRHLAGGARKVLISAPGKGADATIVL